MLGSRIVLCGHPFSTTGVGEHLRGLYRGLRKIGLDVSVFDIFGYDERSDATLTASFSGAEVHSFKAQDVRLFVCNADEVQAVEREFGRRQIEWLKDQSIILPAWELEYFPSEWLPNLERFFCCGGISSFVARSLSSAVGRSCSVVPESAERSLSYLFSRRYFGIPESSYCFLGFHDQSSFRKRKNADAFISLAKRIKAALPFDEISFIYKVKSAPGSPLADDLLEELNSIGASVVDAPLTDVEMTSLLFCSDCLISLHRSEGFGRGPAESMFLGRNVIATNYSGNTDYMNPGNSCAVNYSLIELEEGDYPFWEGQKWADPDIDHASYYARRLINDSYFRNRLRTMGQRAVRSLLSDRAVGLAVSDFVDQSFNRVPFEHLSKL